MAKQHKNGHANGHAASTDYLPHGQVQMPASVEAEVAILGAILMHNDCMWQSEALTADDFSLDSHRRIYKAMCSLAEDHHAIDFVTLTHALNQANELEMAGGAGYVTSLTDGLPRVRNIEQYIQIVRDAAQRRKLIHLMTNALEDAYSQGETTQSLISRIDHELVGIEVDPKSGPKKACEVVKEIRAEFERVRTISAEKSAIGYTTGMKALDEMILGYHKAEMTLIAGDTSSGKSTLMRQGVFANVMAGKKCAVFTFEVKGRQLVTNMLAPLMQMRADKLRDFRQMKDIADVLGNRSEVEEFLQHLKGVNNWPLWIDDSRRSRQIDNLCTTARALIHKEGVEIVFIDQASLCFGKGANPVEQMEYISRAVVDLADSEQVPVVLLSQLTSDKERASGNRPPRKGDVKWAKRLEEDAHCEIMVWTHKDGDYLFVEKQRSGATGSIKATLNRTTIWWDERE